MTTNEGESTGYQPYVDSVFHNCPLMVLTTAVLWLARRGAFGKLPRALRGVATVLLPFFVIFTFFAFLSSPLLWAGLKPFGLTRSEAAPVAIFAAVGLFGIGMGWILLRGFFRWIGGRFQYHGVGIGLGPIYLYFRKRTVR
jgi:hypothetical protein